MFRCRDQWIAPEVRMSLAMVTSPESLLQALQAQSLQRDRRLPITLGRQARNDDDDNDDALAHHWLVPGGVVELSALPGAGAWTVAFILAAAARRRAMAVNGPRWLGALDPWGTLSAVALAHVLRDDDAMAETLVVRPRDEDSLMRTAARMTRSRACAAIVVDAAGFDDVSGLVLGMRRLTLAAEESGSAVLLVTSAKAVRRQPLPVAARALIDAAPDGTVLRGIRHRHGMPPRLLVPKARLQRSVIDDLLAAQRLPAVVDDGARVLPLTATAP